MFIDACNAGKDVYVEKPLSLTVVEGRRMVETADRTKRVVQVGIQRRSSKMLQEAAEFVRAGGIGQVTVAKGFHLQNEWPNGIGDWPDAAPPSEQEWDSGSGPAPKVPYNENRTYLQLPLVLQLLGRAGDELRRALRRHAALVPGAGCRQAP